MKKRYSYFHMIILFLLEFIYFEKATKFCEISTVVLSSHLCSNGQIYFGDLAKFSGLLRIYERYNCKSYSIFNFFSFFQPRTGDIGSTELRSETNQQMFLSTAKCWVRLCLQRYWGEWANLHRICCGPHMQVSLLLYKGLWIYGQNTQITNFWVHRNLFFKLLKHGHFWINFRFWLVWIELRKKETSEFTEFSTKTWNISNWVIPSAFICIGKLF